jgi:hypothetical protein
MAAPKLEEVFKTSGMPTFTFVKPIEYDRLIVGLRTAGRGLVVEGPSGIGKTTSVLKALEELGLMKDTLTLSARKAEELPGLEQDHHQQTFQWKVGQLPLIVPMDSARSRSTRRACRDAATSTQLHLDRPILRAKTD